MSEVICLCLLRVDMFDKFLKDVLEIFAKRAIGCMKLDQPL